MAKTNAQTPIETPELTPNQLKLLEHAARVLYIAAATKTGKTFALCVWIADGLLRGERVCWIGPWFSRTKAAFEIVKGILAVPIQRGFATALETTCQIRASNGGRLDSYSGDNAEAIYGDAYDRVVIDEASRQSEKSLVAALTTVSATKGKIRLAFNLDRGSRNWAVASFLRLRAMSPEEREAAGEDFLTMPTATEGFVDAASIALLRSKMPKALGDALFDAIVPNNDLMLFRGLDEIFVGTELTAPAPGRVYHAGIDLGRKADWSVLTIQDDLGAVVAGDRFNEISWSLQVQRAAALYRRFRCQRAIVDATGIGDPVIEELRKQSLTVEPFMFTGRSKKELVESLIVACDARQITIPATPKFEVFRQELETFEYQFSANGEIRYGAPSGMHDDCVMSVALATHQLRSGYSVSHAFLDLHHKRRHEAGEFKTSEVNSEGFPVDECTMGPDCPERVRPKPEGAPAGPGVQHLQAHERYGEGPCDLESCPYRRKAPPGDPTEWHRE